MPRLMEEKLPGKKERKKKRKTLIMKSLLRESLSVVENDAVGETAVQGKHDGGRRGGG